MQSHSVGTHVLISFLQFLIFNSGRISNFCGSRDCIKYACQNTGTLWPVLFRISCVFENRRFCPYVGKYGSEKTAFWHVLRNAYSALLPVAIQLSQVKQNRLITAQGSRFKNVIHEVVWGTICNIVDTWMFPWWILDYISFVISQTTFIISIKRFFIELFFPFCYHIYASNKTVWCKLNECWVELLVFQGSHKKSGKISKFS